MRSAQADKLKHVASLCSSTACARASARSRAAEPAGAPSASVPAQQLPVQLSTVVPGTHNSSVLGEAGVQRRAGSQPPPSSPPKPQVTKQHAKSRFKYIDLRFIWEGVG